METKYQVIKIGHKLPYDDDIFKIFYHHIKELGIAIDCIKIIDETNFYQYEANAPTFCLYYGHENGVFKNQDILDKLINDATLILPIVADLTNFRKLIPSQLHNINGFELASANSIEALVSSMLEGLSLLRLSRRLFISYKRDESSTVAIQLFEQMEKKGFDVFLDTHSIRPGDPFQDELWHRMADTDIIILLNTPGFLNSDWTTQELAKANSMSIGILQLIWPTHKLEREAELSISYYLKETDFGNNKFNDSQSYLVDDAIQEIVKLSESLRARSLAARQDNIVTEFMKTANKLRVPVDLQPGKFITLKKTDSKEIVIIPTVGVPQAFTYHQSEEIVSRIKAKKADATYILYDHINIREKWLEHLAWLDNYLPIKAKKIIDTEAWLQNL